MSINKIGLKNFKCFKEVEVDFSKITLLTGENSSGKSSLIYGLLIPFQSYKFPLYLSPNGKYINMGDFREISFKNFKNNNIEINIKFNKYQYNRMGIDILTSWVLNPINGLPILYKLQYCEGLDRFDIFKYPNLGNDHQENLEILADEKPPLCMYYHFNSKTKEKDTIKEIHIENIDELLFFRDYEDEEFEYFMRKIFDIDNKIVGFDENINFLGSYRLDPKRTYYQKSKSTNRILSSGEGFIDQILEWQQKGYQKFNHLIAILKELKLVYDVKPEKLGGGRFDLKVRVKRGSNWASLADVGFGISQLLPIIVADLQLDNNSTLIMAQPETHLHPSIQAELGTYLVKQVNQLEKQYIIETHSEYLINRLRLSIVKGEIKPEDVAAYYFENTAKEGSIAHRIEFTKQGQILNAPQGFFDTYMMDTMNIALNA